MAVSETGTYRAKAVASSGEEFVFEFEAKPFGTGASREVYRGRILAPEKRAGERVVIKLFREEIVNIKRVKKAADTGLLGGLGGALGGALLGAASGYFLGSGSASKDRDGDKEVGTAFAMIDRACLGALGGGLLGSCIGDVAGYVGKQINEADWSPDVRVSMKAQEFATAYNQQLAKHDCGTCNWRVEFYIPIVAKLEEPVCLLPVLAACLPVSIGMGIERVYQVSLNYIV